MRGAQPSSWRLRPEAGRLSAGRLKGWPALPAIAVATVVLLRLGFDQGGYFPAAFTTAAAVTFIALAVLIVRPVRRPSPISLVALGALGAFAVWMGLARAWSVVPDASLLDMQRGLLYLALFALGLLAATTRRNARLLIWCVLALALVFAGAGLLSRLQPDLLRPAIDPFSVLSYRLDYPFGYWNAFGAMASLGTVLALGLAADERGHTALRGAAAGACVLLVAAMYLSLSRGAWLALILGVVVLIAIAPNRGCVLLTVLIAGGAAAIAIVRLRGYPALAVNPQLGTGQEAQGDTFTRELLALALLAAAAQVALARFRAGTWLGRQFTRIRRLTIVTRGVIAVVAAASVLIAVDSPARNGVSSTINSATGWVDQQWRDFLDPESNPGATATRLLSAKGSRSDAYRVAIDGFEAHPLLGEGPGSFEVRYARDRRSDLKLRNAHSLALETLSELGLVGFALLLAFVAAVATAARRACLGGATIRPAEAAAVAAAFIVWLAHACVDWDWQIPALTGSAIVMCAALFPRGPQVLHATTAAQRLDMLPPAVRPRVGVHPRRRSRMSWSTVQFRQGTPSMRRRAWRKLGIMILVAGAIGAAVGIGFAQLGRDGNPSSTPTAAAPPPQAPASPAPAGVGVSVLDAVLHPAGTPSGAARRRARLTVRIRVENHGTTLQAFARPLLIVGNATVRTDPHADTPKTYLPSLAAGQTTAVMLRFEVAGALTSDLMTRRRAQLTFAAHSVAVFVKLGAPIHPPQQPSASAP